MRRALFTILGIAGVAAAQSGATLFSVTIAAVHDVVKSGSEVRINIIVKNTSDHEIFVGRSPGNEDRGRLTDVEVRDGKDRVIREREDRHERSGSVITFSLKPDEALKDGLVVTERVDLSRPGKYTIRVWRYDETTTTRVASNPITVTVTD